MERKAVENRDSRVFTDTVTDGAGRPQRPRTAAGRALGAPPGGDPGAGSPA